MYGFRPIRGLCFSGVIQRCSSVIPEMLGGACCELDDDLVLRLQNPSQVLGEVARSRVAILLPLCDRLQGDTIQIWRDLGDELARRLRLVFAQFAQ